MTKSSYDVVPRLSLKDKIYSVKFLGDIAKPALIFEGNSDVHVYSRLLKLSEVDRKKFDIVVGECKTNILNYHDKLLIPFKYLAVLDSDFDRYNNKCRDDENLIYTHFYDMENYLTTSEVVHSTFSDLNDVYTNDITEEQLYLKMIDCLFAFIVAIKYKLMCLALVDKGEDIPIFQLEDNSIKNEKWWDNKNKKVDLDKMKNAMIQFYKEKDIDFDENAWNNIISETKQEYIDKKVGIPVDIIIKGRRLIEGYYFVFQYFLETVMKKREGEVFFNDLRKNISKSTHAQNIIKEIDRKLKLIVA